jgi:hypothetical protein
MSAGSQRCVDVDAIGPNIQELQRFLEKYRAMHCSACRPKALADGSGLGVRDLGFGILEFFVIGHRFPIPNPEIAEPKSKMQNR